MEDDELNFPPFPSFRDQTLIFDPVCRLAILLSHIRPPSSTAFHRPVRPRAQACRYSIRVLASLYYLTSLTVCLLAIIQHQPVSALP